MVTPVRVNKTVEATLVEAGPLSEMQENMARHWKIPRRKACEHRFKVISVGLMH